MSEISSTSSTSASASSGAAAHRSGHGSSRQGATNLFSNLLSQVSASRLQQPLADGVSPQTADLPPGTTDNTDATGAGTSDNPLSDLLGWMDQTQERNPLSPIPSEGDGSSTSPSGALLLAGSSAVAAPLQGLTLNPSISSTDAPTSDPIAAAAKTLAAPTAAPILATSRPEAPPAAGAATDARLPSGTGIDITGMRPVAPGTPLTRAEVASLLAKGPGSGTPVMEANSARPAPSATPPGVSTAALAPASMPPTTPLTTAVSPQPVATPPATNTTPPATEDSDPNRARVSTHGQRVPAKAGLTTTQTGAAPSTSAPTASAADAGSGTPTALPTPTSTSASGRSATTTQDRVGKSTSPERSTVALDERFARTQAEAATVRDSRTESASVPAMGLAGSDASPTSRADLAPLTSAAPATDAARTAEARGTDLAGQPMEAEPASVSHWSTQHLRHASLRVGEGSQEAIDIQLSMDGQELNVDFRTDNAEARAALSQQADQSLGSLLERSGIQLGGVSVGAQNQQGQQPRQTPITGPAPSTGTGTGQDSGPQAPGAAPRGQLAARPDSSRPLDLFV